MRVGTDSVLLGAWAGVHPAQRILDVGTGTGIIGLMTAQRNPTATVDAIDIQSTEVDLARTNFQNSPWAERLHAHLCALQQWQAPAYNHIVSNPPFFSSGQKAPRATRAMARHAESLPHADLLMHAKRLLAEGGKLSVVIPATEKSRLTEQAQQHGLFVARECAVYSKPGKSTERFLLEFTTLPHVPAITTLTLYDAVGMPSREYQRLTGDFYL